MPRGRKKTDTAISSGFSQRLSLYVKDNEKTSFGKKIGVSGWMITKYMNGSIPSADILLLISKEIGRPMEWLLTGREEEISRSIKPIEHSSATNQPPDFNLLLKIIEEQGARITEQGHRIDTVTEMAKKAQSDTDSLRDLVFSIQKTINDETTVIKSKMKKAAETEDLKALGE